VSTAHHALPPEQILEKVKHALSNGLRAGVILDRLLGNCLGLGHDPILKVAKGAAADLDLRDICGEEHVSASKIENTIWKHYKPVAHFWAAHIYRWEGKFPCAVGEIENFLALAEAFRKIGETFELHQKGEFALDAAKTWRLPEGLPIPKLKLVFNRREDSVASFESQLSGTEH